MNQTKPCVKNLITFLLATICGFCFYGCGSDALDQECIMGVVLYEIPCNSANGSAYLIKVERGGITDSIATTTLPSIYKVEGQEIFFFVREPEHHLICVTSIIPPKKEYDIYNVSNNACLYE